MYTDNEFKNLVFGELRSLKFQSGYVWEFKAYNKFKFNLQKPVKDEEFDTFIKKMVEDGIFTIENDVPCCKLVLTDKGEDKLWRG